MAEMRENFGAHDQAGRVGLAFLGLLLFLFVSSPLAAQQKIAPEARSELPFGAYPSVHTLEGAPLKENDSLGGDMKDLSQRIKTTVKTVAAHRNLTCFGDPCLVQAFPLLYTKLDSGFFGGVRAKMTDISRTRPYLYSLETGLLRSDSHQWEAFVAFDFPEIRFLPFDPRLKLHLEDLRSTETRYYGSGPSFDPKLTRPDPDYRYAEASTGFQSSLIIPLFSLDKQKVSLFSSFASRTVSPGVFRDPASSKIVDDQPLGWEGGVSSRAGVGLLLDSRDRETLTRQGWELEVSSEFSGPPLGRYKFHRVSLIDRRYFSSGPFTLGHRLTVDSISGKPPFWELSGVGGIDPIDDVTASTILNGYPNGRFHEKLKIIESLELRWAFNPRRIFGLLCQTTLVPAAVDIGRLGVYSALSGSIGSKFLFNRTLLVQTFASLSSVSSNLTLSFGEEF
jgi:hypothetical protein